MSKIFVTQHTSRANYSALLEHGSDVVFLTDKEYAPEPSMPQTNDKIYHEMKRNLSAYIQGEDFIVTTGSAIPNILVGILISGMPGEHRVLKWSNQSRAYFLHTVRI